MDINFREAETKDKNFILNANKEINKLSGLNDSTFENNIDNDLFENKICKAIVAEDNKNVIGFILYSYIYWANCGKGIYLSQAYIKKEYRNKGIYKMLLNELETREKDCKFITDYVGNENKAMLNVMDKLGFKPSDLKIFYKKINKKSLSFVSASLKFISIKFPPLFS